MPNITYNDDPNGAGVGAGTDDQTAAEVPVTPAGNLASTNVQAALAELQGDVDAVDLTNAGQVIDFVAPDGTTQHDVRTPTGNALPADDSETRDFHLVGHATLPDGTYWYNSAISQWVIL